MTGAHAYGDQNLDGQDGHHDDQGDDRRDPYGGGHLAEQLPDYVFIRFVYHIILPDSTGS